MEGEPEIGVLDEGEEPKRAVLYPLEQNGFSFPGNLGLDESTAFANRPDLEAVLFQQSSIGAPARVERTLGIVKQVHVARKPWGSQRLVERGTNRDVTFARSHPASSD